MYRGCRRLVCSLVCVFSILCMLFLDTCTVEAGSGIYSSSLSGTFYCSADTTWFSYSTSATDLVYPNYYYITGGQHFDIPFKIYAPVSSFPSVSLSTTGYYQLTIGNVSFNISGGTASNICLKDANGELMWQSGDTWGTKKFLSGNFALNNEMTYFIMSGYLSFDFVYTAGRTASNETQYTSGNWSFTSNLYVSNTTLDYVASSGSVVTDPVLNESVTALQEDTSQTAENTSGILSKITDFFGSFFENLIGIFVPEDGYFSGWFDRVNTLLSEKLGMLYAPFDLVISTLQAIYSSSTSESGIPFPGIKWEDTWLVEPFTFTFASLGSDFDDLRDKVYFATDTVLVLTFLMLLQSKVKLILEGHE